MRAAILAAAVLCGVSGAARADVTFRLVNPVYSVFTNSVGASLALDLTISNAAVTRGSFKLQGLGNGSRDLVFTGDTADFISFTANEGVRPNYLFGTLSLSATFDAAGIVTSFSEIFQGQGEMSSIAGSAANLSGTFGSDNYGFRCGSTSCQVLSSQFVQVPEPISMSILGSGLLLGLAARRRA